MKKLTVALGALSLMLAAASCGTQKDASPAAYGVSVKSAKTLKPDTLGAAGMDSVLKADRLPELGKWTAASYKDEETGRYSKYYTLYDPETGVTYVAKPLDGSKTVLFKREIRIR